MKRPITNLVIGCLAFFASQLAAQPTFTVSPQSITASPGQTISVDIVVTNFTSIVSFQYSMNWNPAVLQFQSPVTNITPLLAGFTSANFGLTQTGSGILTLSWFDPPTTGATLANGTVLYRLSFLVLTSTPTNISFSGNPTPIEVVVAPTNIVIPVMQGASVNGGSGGGGGGGGGGNNPPVTGFAVIASDEIGVSGSQVCVDVSVNDFDDIVSMQYTMEFDESKWQYSTIQGFNLPGLSIANFGTNQAGTGRITISWLDPNATGITLPDATVIYQVCLTAIGPNNCGSTTPFQFNSSLTPVEITNGAGMIVPFQGITGDLEICGTAPPPPAGLTITASQETGVPGAQVCVDFTADDFDCIVSAQFSIHFNQNILQWGSAQGFGLPGLVASNFGTSQAGSGTITFSWFDPTTNGVTVADSTVIFQLCFNVIGTGGQSSPITFNGTPTAIEVTNCNNGQVVTPTFVAGSVTVASNTCNGPVTITNSSVTNVNCFGQSTGAIDITDAGGSAIKTYVWKNAAGVTVGTTQDLSGLAAGTYSVTVISCSGSETTTGSYTVTQPATALSFNFQATDVACFGEATGAIDITVTGGTNSGTGCTGYTYAWSNGATTADLTGLDPGTFTVTVTDCKGCQITSSTITIDGPPSAFNSTATGHDVKCNGGIDGSIVMSASGGTPPYEYMLGNGAWTTTSTFTGLAAGSFTVKSRDAFGCIKTANVVVGTPTAIAVFTVPTNPTAGMNNGSIATTVTGGVPPYTFSWSGPNGPITGNPQNPSGLSAGTYCVTVTDFNGCTKPKCQLVSAPITDNGSTQINACVGVCSGEIDVQIIGGVMPYTYSWTGGLIGPNPTDVCPGDYTVEVKSISSGQTLVLNFTVTQATSSPQVVSANVDDPTSTALCTGEVTLNQTVGGFGPPYTYQWSNLQSGNTSFSLCDEVTYTVTISDANGCTGTAQYTPDFEIVPIIAQSGATNSCSTSSDGTLTVTVADGGIGPFDFQISGPSGTLSVFNDPDGQHTFTGLAAGDYGITITDNGTGVDQQIITGTQTVLSTNLTIDPVDVYPATSTSKGKITLTPAGGQIPYSFSWSNGSHAQNPEDLNPGTYTVTIGDGSGCYQVYQVQVTLFSVTDSNLNQPSCAGQLGSITATATGSPNTPYDYVWENSSGFEVGDDATVDNILPGTYFVTITDALGVTIVETYQLDALSNLSGSIDVTSNYSGYDVKCNGDSNGIALATPINGVAPYSYQWSNGATTQSTTGLSEGTMFVFITDAQGCGVVLSDSVIAPGPLTAQADAVNLGCADSNNGQATVIVSGGAIPYYYQWNDPDGSKTPTVSQLEGGSYRVTVTDANGCTMVKNVFIPVLTPMVVDDNSVPDSGGPNGQAIATVSGGTWPYEFTWQNNSFDVDSILTEQYPGIYFVIVEDANGCQVTKFLRVEDETLCGEVLTVFTPNGDENNEEFKIGCLTRFSDNILEIYNRWGQQVYQTDNYNNDNLWRGLNSAGEEVPDGVYFYVFDYLDPATNVRVTKKGSVTVLRK
ncbi:MAG: gliding motility-associated C-terminal domain-containing protein [Bacteroidetes bacterium]|nr:gliding motility-associated C-terminal domain-containing protein [Bacteroidota bacterium]